MVQKVLLGFILLVVKSAKVFGYVIFRESLIWLDLTLFVTDEDSYQVARTSLDELMQAVNNLFEDLRTYSLDNISLLLQQAMKCTTEVDRAVAPAFSSDWSYDKYNEWPAVCYEGKKQSPIDLDPDLAQEKSFIPFQFRNYKHDYTARATNNGHSLMVKLEHMDVSIRPKLQGSSLPEEFTLDHIHFHWRSEHTVDDRRYPAEAHFVHYATRLGNMSEAVKKPDGLAVLGVLFNLSPDEAEDLKPITSLIAQIANKQDQSVQLSEKISPKDLLPEDTAGFYRYRGSLTTPGCNEVVIWTVFTNSLVLSKSQADLLETLHTKDGLLTHNYRPIQALNDRPLFLKKSPIFSGVPAIVAPTLSIIFCATLLKYL